MKSLFVILSVLLFFNYTFSQEEEDAVKERWEWYNGQRAYPYDTIPSGAYKEAYEQKMLQIQTNGIFLSNLTWQELGPKPYENYSARIADIEYDPTDETGQSIYIAAGEGGIWKTTNSGANWFVLGNQMYMNNLVSGCLTIDPNNANVLYYGTGGVHLYGEGVFKSTDKGVTWSSIWNTTNNPILPRSTVIFQVAVRPNHPDEILVADQGGLFRTVDGGLNWQRMIPQTGVALWCTDVVFCDEDIVIASGPSPLYFDHPFSGIGLWRSTNGGINWQDIQDISGFPHLDDEWGRSHLAITIAAPNVVYLYTYYDISSTPNYVYKSTNYGQTFDAQTPVYLGSTGLNSGYNHFIRCSPLDENLVIAGFQNPFLSTNGSSFTDVLGGMHKDFHSVAFSPFNINEVFLGGDGGIHHSSNGGSNWYWTYPYNYNNDLGISESYHVSSSIYNENIILCGLQDEGVAKKNNGSTAWTSTYIGGGDGTAIIHSPFKSNIALASQCIWGRPVYYTTDNNNFTFSNIDDQNGQRSTLITPFASHPKIPGIFYNARNVDQGNTSIRFYKSTNDGHLFSNITFPLASGDEGTPQSLAISSSNPDYIAFCIGDYSDYWNKTNQIYKSIDGGLNFSKILTVHPDVPDKFFTHLEFDPTDENIIYLTVSGFDEGHVFRTTNGGANWENLSANLPDAPANDLIIRYPDATSKEILVATDEGVWRADANSTPATITWEFLANDLPNTHIIDLDYNRLSNKLRSSAFGRGIWEVDLPGDIYVQDELYITDNTSIDKNIIVCSGGKLNLGYNGFSQFNISMENGAKIIVKDGGYLNAGSNNQFTISSQSQWGGIEFQGTGYGTLDNVTFSNTNTPISIVTGNYEPQQQHAININGCHFNDGYVSIDNRSFVTIQDCYWNYSSSLSLSVTGIISIGSDVITLQGNHITPTVAQTGPGISVVYGSDIYIDYNEISNVDVGITISNTSPYISRNTLTHSATGLVGIGFDNSYASTVTDNTITGYDEGFRLGASSPVMYNNSSDYNDGSAALIATYYSSPRLRPLVTEEDELIIDAGYNILRTNQTGMNISGLSIPDIENGCNTIYGESGYDIEGSVGSMIFYLYYAYYNDWVNNPPDGKFNISDATVFYDPYGCPQGGPGGENENITSPEILNPDPPQPLIVNRGNGFYDTLTVKSSQLQFSADKVLYSRASKQELLRNFSQAITLYQQVISNYQDNLTSIEAMKRIIECYDKNNSDTSAYSILRNYYTNLAQNNLNDTPFVKTALELGSKCLVRINMFSPAITEFENTISHSNDSLEILYNELNVIETYMIIPQSGGDNFGFTGKLSYLKPVNHKAGLELIKQKLYKIGTIKHNIVPPKQFSLSQNYPNPFNPFTKINYSLPQGTKVSIKIFDILGKLVQELVNEYKEAGTYTATFDGSNFASGVYFYRIEAGKFIDTKKMVLIK